MMPAKQHVTFSGITFEKQTAQALLCRAADGFQEWIPRYGIVSFDKTKGTITLWASWAERVKEARKEYNARKVRDAQLKAERDAQPAKAKKPTPRFVIKNTFGIESTFFVLDNLDNGKVIYQTATVDVARKDGRYRSLDLASSVGAKQFRECRDWLDNNYPGWTEQYLD